MNKINLEKIPELVQLHVDYINSGADIITTNTYRTNHAVEKEELQNLVQNAVQACKEAIK